MHGLMGTTQKGSYTELLLRIFRHYSLVMPRILGKQLRGNYFQWLLVGSSVKRELLKSFFMQSTKRCRWGIEANRDQDLG